MLRFQRPKGDYFWYSLVKFRLAIISFFFLHVSQILLFLSRQEPQLVKTVREGGYFGELALITQEPRAATCKAKTDVRLLAMSRDAFERLIGEGEDIFRDSIAAYRIVNAAL